VALVVAVLLVGGLVRAAGGSDEATSGAANTSWSSAYGTNMRAGFMDGCQKNMGRAVNCGCVFAKLTGQPSYSTPRDFATLAKEMEATKQVPAGYMQALNDCRTA
jgi:hypothetical protein